MWLTKGALIPQHLPGGRAAAKNDKDSSPLRKTSVAVATGWDLGWGLGP